MDIHEIRHGMYMKYMTIVRFCVLSLRISDRCKFHRRLNGASVFYAVRTTIARALSPARFTKCRLHLAAPNWIKFDNAALR